MKKIRPVTEINLPRNNKGKCAIYEHEGKFYITDKVGKSYNPLFFDGKYYCLVEKIELNENEHWFTV